MFFRILISLLISIYLFSIPCFAMDEAELLPPSRHAPLLPFFEDIFMIKDSRTRERLLPIQTVYLKDKTRLNLAPHLLEKDETIKSLKQTFLSLDDLTFERIRTQLDEQERVCPLTSLDLLKHRITQLIALLSIAPQLSPPHHQFYFFDAPDIDRLGRVFADVLRRNQSIGIIGDVHGVMTNEADPTTGTSRTLRGDIGNLLSFMNARRSKIVAASAYADFPSVLKDLRTIGLDKLFNVRTDNAFTEVNGRNVVIRKHGNVAAARQTNWIPSDPHFRQKGLTLDLAFPNEHFHSIIIFDDSWQNLRWVLLSLLQSKSYQTARYIYLVEVGQANNPVSDVITPQTWSALHAEITH